MNSSHFSNLTIELSVGFIALLLLTKILGKTQISQITPFDFISAIVLGELVGNAIYDNEVNVFYILYAMAFWGLLIFVVEKITQKYIKTVPFFDGKPSIIIRNGKIDYNQLKKEKLNMNELLSQLRQKDVFSIREIEYAIFEPSGSISVLKKSKYDVPSKQDLNLPQKTAHLSISLIIDGQVLSQNLKSAGFDKKWLEAQIKTFNISNVEDVLYAEWKEDEGLYVVPYK